MSTPNLHVELDVIVQTPAAGLDLDDVERLVPFVLEREGRRGPWAVAVVLTDDESLRRLHRDFMGLDTETDVMTFPVSDDAAPGSAEQGGDIVVSVGRAAAQAAELGQTTADEVRFLIVHGLLHLSGWTDETEAARRAMWDRQRALLDAFAATTARR